MGGSFSIRSWNDVDDTETSDSSAVPKTIITRPPAPPTPSAPRTPPIVPKAKGGSKRRTYKKRKNRQV
jgi:hypothetical protein